MKAPTIFNITCMSDDPNSGLRYCVSWDEGDKRLHVWMRGTPTDRQFVTGTIGESNTDRIVIYVNDQKQTRGSRTTYRDLNNHPRIKHEIEQLGGVPFWAAQEKLAYKNLQEARSQRAALVERTVDLIKALDGSDELIAQVRAL